MFYLPSHHPRASLATSAQGNCLQRSPSNGEKASTASTTLSVLFSGLLMASPVPHQISSCSLSTSITADFNLTIRWGDKKMSHHTYTSTIYINFTWLTRSKYEIFKKIHCTLVFNYGIIRAAHWLLLIPVLTGILRLIGSSSQDFSVQWSVLNSAGV